MILKWVKRALRKLNIDVVYIHSNLLALKMVLCIMKSRVVINGLNGIILIILGKERKEEKKNH